jgi:hypothetical protein
MYVDNSFDQSKIVNNIMEISNERDELEEENKLDKEKERELLLRQFYQGLKLCTRNNYNFK